MQAHKRPEPPPKRLSFAPQRDKSKRAGETSTSASGARRASTSTSRDTVLCGGTPSPKKRQRHGADGAYELTRPAARPLLGAFGGEQALQDHLDAETQRKKFVKEKHERDLIDSTAKAPSKSHYLKKLKRAAEEKREAQERELANLRRSNGFGERRDDDVDAPKRKRSVDDKSSGVIGRREQAQSEQHKMVAEPRKPGTTTMHTVEYNDDEGEEAHTGFGGDLRHNDGSLKVKLQYGPKALAPPKDDPEWEKKEPNSGIHLRARELAQQQLDLHLEDRYLVQPASLYQIARGSKRSAIDMDVPVVGDWVMIAVLAEKGEIRFVNAQKPVKKGAKKDADKDEVDEKDRKKKKRRKPEDDDSSGGESALDGSDDEADKSRQERDAKPRRYISFKMVDLSSAKTSSAGQSSVSLYLYESDSRAGDVKRGEDGVERGAYRGGSGGAYERWWKESEGAVLAILNPRVTKPFNNPKASNFGQLSLQVDSADSIIVIGRAQHLAHCTARRVDGRVCNAWCDKRTNTVCEFHVRSQVSRNRSSRAELYGATSSMNAVHTTSGQIFGAPSNKASKSSVKPDPERKMGLLPANTGGARMIEGAMTYVYKGGPSGAGAQQKKQHALTTFGSRELSAPRSSKGVLPGYREGPTVEGTRKDAIEARKLKQRREEEMLLMIERDGGHTLGGQYLQARSAPPREKLLGKADKPDKLDKLKRKRHQENVDDLGDSSAEEEEAKRQRAGFSASTIRRIGFDPRLAAQVTMEGQGAKSSSLTKEDKKLQAEHDQLVKSLLRE